MADLAPNTLSIHRPRSAANAEERTIFPPAIFTTATYTQGILVPNNSTAAADVEKVTFEIPNDYFRNDGNNRDRSLPMLSPEEANYWSHSIAAHAAARRRPPMEVGRLLGTITLHFEETTSKKSSRKKPSLFYSSRKYGCKSSGERRKPSVKDSGKQKALSVKKAWEEAYLEMGLDEDTNASTLSPEIQNELNRRSQQIFEHWKRIRDSKPLLECWNKQDGGLMPQSLGNVHDTPENEFYVPILCLLEWLSSGGVTDLAAGRVKSLYNGLCQVKTDANTILESLIDLSCPASLYKIPLVTSYAVARRVEHNNNTTQWKVRIGVYMNRLLPEVLTEKHLQCVMSALDDDSFIVSEPLHLPPIRDPHDPVFESNKFPIVKMPGAKVNDDLDVEDEMSADEEKKEDEDELPVDPAMIGSSRETKTISPFTPRGLLKLLENSGNVTSMFPEISRSLAPYLKLDLMLHQQHAVCWMTQMEQLPGFGINSIIWEEREFFDGNKYYYSPALGQIRLNRPPVTVGGCVADEMGLGKTIQMLSLIASSLDELKREASDGFEGTNCTHATLIVVPPALVMQWVSEVKKCCGESLTVNVLDANNHAGIQGLVEGKGNGTDILVTTYSALEQPKTSRFLATWSWGRIVLDEQQEIRSSTTMIAKNCESLICHRRWMLSGTPIFEGIGDLRGELNFLRLTPYAAKWEDGFFDFSIMSHWNHGSQHAIGTLRILGLLLLRRSKDMIICDTGDSIMQQKKLTVEMVPVAQSESERALYCWFEYIVSQEIQRKDNKFSAKSNLQSRDLCLRLLREICFSAVLVNGGLGAASQMKALNAMYRKLLSRAEQDQVTTHKQKKAGAIRVMSPLNALTYLSQAERTANVAEEFVSDQQFGGGQGASSRTYATDSIEVQVEQARKKVDEATRKEFDARQKRAKANWHLALELITTGALSNDDELLSSASSKFMSLWKIRGMCGDMRGWRPSTSFIKKVHRFPWSRPNTLQLANIPSQVVINDISSALLDTLKKEPNARSKLERLHKRMSQTKKTSDMQRIEAEISNAELLLDQAISYDQRLQPPAITTVNSTSGLENSWAAYVEAPNEDVLEQLIKQAKSKAGIILKSNEVVPHIQAALDEATEKLKQAEAAYSVHPCEKNKQEKVAGQKVVDNARLGLRINFDSAVMDSSTNVIMYHALRIRGIAPRTRSAFLDGISVAIAQASGSLARARASLQDGQSTLAGLVHSLEKGGRANKSSTQQKSAFDTLEALRNMQFKETFCPICQLPFGENTDEDPQVQEKIVAMISCGHFFCINCLDRHVQTEIGRNRSLACPCCRKTFSQTNDVIHIDHLTTNKAEVTAKRAEAKRKVREASEMLATSEGVLDGELWNQLFLSIDVPIHVSNAPHHIHTALPQDALAHFRMATGMKIDCSRSDAPESWVCRKFAQNSNNSGLSSKVQALLKDLPIGEHSVVFSSSKEGVLHLATVMKANGIDCFSLYTGQNTKATEDAVSSWSTMVLDATKTGPVLVVQAGAASSGLTLTAASKLFLMEPFSRQEEEMQAYARCHRYGQKRDVYVKIYYTPVSVESRLLKWRKRSAEKIAALINNNTNYVFSRLYEDEDVEVEEYEDDADIHRVSMSGEDEEGHDCDEVEGADEEDQSAEAGEENLCTQFLLGLVDEDGNPTARNEDVETDNHVAVDTMVSARRFILN